MNKLFQAILDNMSKRDEVPIEKYDHRKVYATIETLCDEHLKDSSDTLIIEALPSAIDSVISILDSPKFLESYECSQISETLFSIKMKDLEIL